MASNGLTSAPAALIRTMEGHIAFWSPAMEQRYGFAPEEAVGRISYELLRTTSWRALGEIEAVLVNRNHWRGGLIHRRADDQPVIAANHWHLHRATDDRGGLVTELHSDIVPAGTDASRELADIVKTIAQEFSEPLTAIGSYMGGVRRGLQPAWPDKMRLGQGVTDAIAQLGRARVALDQLRTLGESLRNPRLLQPHARLAAAFAQTERIVRASREVARQARTVRAESVLARQEREKARDPRRSLEGTGETQVQRAVLLQDSQLFQRLLRRDMNDRLDARTERALKQLLAEKQMELAAHDQQEAAAE